MLISGPVVAQSQAQPQVFSPEFKAFAGIPEGNLQWSNSGNGTTVVTIDESYVGYDDGLILEKRQTRHVSNVQVFTNTAKDARTSVTVQDTIFLGSVPAHTEYIPLPSLRVSADVFLTLGYDDGWQADWSIRAGAYPYGFAPFDGPFVIGRQEIEVIKLNISGD